MSLNAVLRTMYFYRNYNQQTEHLNSSKFNLLFLHSHPDISLYLPTLMLRIHYSYLFCIVI